MQAHPLSSPAARIPSTSPSASPQTSPPASVPTPSHGQSRTHVQPSRKLFSNLSRHVPLSKSPAPTLASTAGLAHDAGNLLGALGLYCDLLSAPGVLRPEHCHYATELNLIFNRSSELIRRLLAVTLATAPVSSRPDNSSLQPPPPGPIRTSTPAFTDNHASVLHSLAPVLQRIAAGVATVSVTCPAALPPLDFPSEVIERITVNLVRNAAEAIRSNIHDKRSNPHNKHSVPAAASPVRGEIHVILAVHSGHLELTVEDNGPGMPPVVAASFLQPSPLPHGATHGLGHRIIHELATASAGQISVRVRPGNGTVFCLKWPIPASGHSPRRSTPSVKTA